MVHLRWKKLNKTTLSVVSIIVLSGLIGTTPFILEETSLEFYEETYESNITILNDTGNNTSVGINSDRNLDFGYVPEGVNSTKFLNVSTKKKSIMNVRSTGNISKLLEYEDRAYFEGYKQVNIEAQGRETGNYTGNITLSFQIPENQVGTKWLDLKYWIYSKL